MKRTQALRALVGMSIACVSFGAHAQAVITVAPDEFIGQYKLKDTVSGYCFDDLRVMSQVFDSKSLDMSVGSYFFPRVNAGPQSYEDFAERGEYESKTTEQRELIYSARYFDKLQGMAGTRLYRVTLQDEGLLRLRAEFRGTSSFNTECVYERIETVPEEP